MIIFCLWTRLGRTMTSSSPQLYTSHMLFDVYMPKVAPKWLQRGPKVTFIWQKWSQSNPKSINTSPRRFIKWSKSVWKVCFFENGPSYTQSDSTMIPKSSSHDPMSPTDTRSDPKLAPKWRQSAPKNTLICRKWFQNDRKVPLKPPLSAKIDHKVIPKSPSYAKSDPKVIHNCPFVDLSRQK